MHQGGCERWRRVGAEQEAAQFFCVSATDTSQHASQTQHGLASGHLG